MRSGLIEGSHLMKPSAIVAALCCLVAGGVASTTEPARARSDAASDFCAVRDSIQAANVMRTSPLGSRSFTFPARVSIATMTRARAIASAVCALPAFPGARHCPADYGIRYLVRFREANLRVSIDPSGCQTVSGAGPLRWATPAPSFWRTVGRAMGMPAASLSTFRGRKF
jgi:hypothetical protein